MEKAIIGRNNEIGRLKKYMPLTGGKSGLI